MRAGCGHFAVYGAGAGAVPSKQAKQRFGAVRVQRCGLISKQGLGAWFLC